MKVEFVLIDFENVQPKDLALLSAGSHKIKVFVGNHQAKIPVAMARALQAFGPDVEYVQVNGSGSNAADFHIAYHIGRLAATTQGARFHVISKDTGFDPLLKHLAEQGVSCRRSPSISAMFPAPIPILSQALAPASAPGRASITERVEAVVENLKKRKAAKPRTLKTLRSTIKALFGRQLMDDELERLIEHLTRRGVIKIAAGKLQYELPT